MGDYSKIKFRSDFLLSKKSFGVGAGSAFNLFGNYFKYNTSKNGVIADRKAFVNDVGVIHQDYMSVINCHNQKKLHKIRFICIVLLPFGACTELIVRQKTLIPAFLLQVMVRKG